MSYHFIRSATIHSYESRGKETWFQLLVNPTNESSYRIYRCYEDFLKLDAQLDSAYYTATKATIARSHTAFINSHYQHNNDNNTSGSNNNNNNRRKIPSYINQLCEKTGTTTVSSSTLSLPTTASSTSAAVTSPSSSSIATEITTLPNLRSRHPTQEIYWLANKRAKRKWQQKHIERYLSRLFVMPFQVSQSFIVLRFFNYQPHRYYHFTKALPPTPPSIRQMRRQRKHCHNTVDNNINIQPNFNSHHDNSDDDTPRYAKTTAPATRRKLSLRHNNKNKKKKKNHTSTITMNEEIDEVEKSIKDEKNGTVIASPVSVDIKSQTATLLSPTSTVHSWNSEDIQIFLFLSSKIFITVRIHRRSTLEELRSALDQELIQHNLDPLPISSVLAYHHVGRSDRQGALYTLTLNCSEPCLDQDTLMTLTSAKYLSFFSKASNFLSPSHTLQQEQEQLKDEEKEDEEDNNSTSKSQHQIEQGIVLLIASDADLEVAMNGKWRRLEHVTLTCLAW
ncbi:hypothetical protein BDC45DRAFT_572325 [Circinella umbellata]|nr:hypothetical protein BDC45DRAFT_572325 [Circinella umbellata]